jgi:antitoxin component YwqK of YwqJK toxin-antitoxin module
MSTGRKALKVILWILVSILVIVGGIAAYFYFSDSGKRNALTVIPEDAIYIIETNNLTEGWATLRESKMWRHLLQSPKFDDINGDIISLDSLINGNKTLDLLFKNRQLVISAHMTTLTDYDFIFAVNLSKASKISFLTKYIKDIVGYYDYSYSERNYSGTEIIELTNAASHEIISLCFIDNILACSFSPILIEKSIKQKDSEFWAKNPNVRFVSTEIKGNKLFNFYINFSRVNDFMRSYLSESSSFVNSMSKSLYFSAFNVTFDNEKLQWDGYTSVNDSIPSYYKAIVDQSPGKFKAYEIISEKAALYVSMSFGSSESFFDKLKEVFRAEDTTKAQDYEKTIKKVEKVLKVDLQQDFFSWIGNELAFVKLQPSPNANEYDAIAIIHANDIDKATSSMEKIARKVKKRSFGLLKFEDTDYKNFTIKYLEYGWFLKLCFGKLLGKFDKPYYIFMDDYVVYSNSPSCLMDFIDDYTMGKTLSHNKEFNDFLDNFETKSNISVFVQMPRIYSHLYYYSKADKRKGIKDNKETILSFTRVGLQLTADNKMFKTKLVADFDETAAFNSDLENIEAAAEDLYLNTIDSGTYKIEISNGNIAKTGPVKIYYDDSTTLKAEGRALNDKPDGLWRSYFPDGKIMCAVTYKDGMANGLAMFYFDDEKQITRVELTFEDDKIEGIYREFYENGNRKAMLNFNEGVPDGDAEFYYDSGVIKIEGQYKDGLKQGKWKHYTETGELIDKEKWKKDQPR